jgi:putative oxidoreductase
MSPKLAHFEHELVAFPDPMGIGHQVSFAVALLSAGACSLVVGIGIFARLASMPIIYTMMMVLLMAARGFEGADVQSALLYALPYTVIVLTGPGRWSLDHRLASWYAARWTRLRATSAGAPDAS